MQLALNKYWEYEDEEKLTAADLVFSHNTLEKLEGKENSFNVFSNKEKYIYTVCSTVKNWLTDDHTVYLDATPLQCTYYARDLGAEDLIDWYDYLNSEYKNNLLTSDQCYVSPLEINIMTKDIEKYKNPIFQEIYEVYKSLSEENWDYYGSSPISRAAYFEAIKVAEILPKNIPRPEIIPEPNGNIAFEWYRGKRYVFIISVSGNNLINYAGLFGSVNKTYGTEYFDKEIPLNIIKMIEHLLSIRIT